MVRRLALPGGQAVDEATAPTYSGHDNGSENASQDDTAGACALDLRKSGCQPCAKLLYEPFDIAFEVILDEHLAARRGPESPRHLGIFHQALHCVGNRTGACRRNEQPFDILVDDLRNTRDPGCDTWQFHRHSFHQYDWN